MGKDSFLIYKSFYEPIKGLSDKQLGKLFRSIFEFQISGNELVEDDIRMAFSFFKNQMVIDEGKYQSIVERNKHNGTNGGRPKKVEKETQANPKNPVGLKKPKKADNDNENENENVKDNDKLKVLGDKSPTLTFENRKDSFKNSLIPHVEEYGREMIRSFFDYWTEPNKSKSRMRWEGESYFDVKRRLVTWASREKGFEKLPNNTATNHPVGAMESRVDRMKKVAETAAQLVNQRKNERNSISDN